MEVDGPTRYRLHGGDCPSEYRNWPSYTVLLLLCMHEMPSHLLVSLEQSFREPGSCFTVEVSQASGHKFETR
jgi:hypothetical protein